MSAPQWLQAFGLSRLPFSKELGDDELWVPSSRERVVDAIVEACQDEGELPEVALNTCVVYQR